MNEHEAWRARGHEPGHIMVRERAREGLRGTTRSELQSLAALRSRPAGRVGQRRRGRRASQSWSRLKREPIQSNAQAPRLARRRRDGPLVLEGAEVALHRGVGRRCGKNGLCGRYLANVSPDLRNAVLTSVGSLDREGPPWKPRTWVELTDFVDLELDSPSPAAPRIRPRSGQCSADGGSSVTCR